MDYVQKELSPQAGGWEPKCSTMVDLRRRATLLQHHAAIVTGKKHMLALDTRDALDA